QRRHPPGFAAIDGAFIRFTSGTTAAAKGVVLSHETIYERICAANEVLRFGPGDRVVWLLSMAYHFAVSIVSYLSFGAAVVLLPTYRLRLADVGLGRRLREVLLAGPGVFDAYYDPWRPRAAVMSDGWFHTGDVGAVDAAGCLLLRGRLKDVINVLGMKFFPRE